MYVNLETAYAATLAEQHLAHLRATKLGPLLVEAERKPDARTQPAGPLLSTVVGRLVHQVRSARLKWVREGTKLRPIGER